MNKSKKMSLKQILFALIGGIFVGFLNGYFGGGGGMLVVPLLVYVLGLEDREAHATAIFVILPISIAGAIVYIINNDIINSNLMFSSIGFFIGGIVGALALKKINNKFLRIMFACFMIIAGIKILI